jgi:predicted dehydrogenase
MSAIRHIFAAVVGTGFIGPVHVEALRRLGRPMLGVLGSTPQRSRDVARALNIARAYDSFEELVADPMISVLHLASPNRLHFEQCRQAILAGKHVLCEKPLAVSAAETAQLTALAEASAVVTAVNYNIRFYPLCQEARRRILDGQIGRVHHVIGSYLQDWLLYETDFNWRVLSSEGGPLRAVADIGTHWLDLVQWLIGQPVEAVCADLHTVLPTRRRPRGPVETFAAEEKPGDGEAVNIDTEDHGSLLLRFRGGASGCVTVSQVAPGHKNQLRFEIAGSRASLGWDSQRPNELWIGRRDRPSEVLLRDPALLGDEARRFSDYPGGHNEGFPDTFKQLFRAFYEYLEAGDFQAARPFPTFADGHREALLCDAVLASHRERRWVEAG